MLGLSFMAVLGQSATSLAQTSAVHTKPAAEQQSSPALLFQGKPVINTSGKGLRPGALSRPVTPTPAASGAAARPAATPVVTNITSTTLIKNNGAFNTLNPGLSGTDADNDITQYRFVSIPANGTLGVANAALNGYVAVTAGLVVSAAQAQFLIFAANNGSAVGTRTFLFQAIDGQGNQSNQATYSIQVVNNFAPVTRDFTNATLISNNQRQSLRDLAAWGFTDAENNAASFRFTQLPSTTTMGTLYVNGTPAVVNQTYAIANTALLSFQPVAGYSGTDAIATFTVTDTQGATSGEGRLGIPVNKATCGQASVFDFTTRTDGENWKTNRTVTVANSSVTISNNLGGTSGYSSTAAAGETTFTTDYRAASPGYALDWFTDYSSSANTTSTANFYFNRPLQNFSFTMGDLDKGTAAEGSAFVDDVTFNGYRADGTVVRLDAGDVSLAPNGNNFFNGDNRITGQTNPDTGTGGTFGPDGNVTITFTEPIVRLELIYKNLQTEVSDPGTQAVYISAFTWCEQADVTTTVSGSTYANVGGTVTYNVTTTNNDGLDAAHNVTPTIRLAAGLSGVNVTNGTYNSGNGLVTFNTTPLLASGASVNNTVSFTMPNGTTTGTASNDADTADPVLGNNNGTAAAAKITTVVNGAPVALNVTTSTVAVNSGEQPILPLQATDPQGNGTVASFTILTLPGTNNGTLRFNGANVTVNQVIPADQANELSYTAPATAGTRTFTYRATDDLGTTSNVATYTIPVVAANVAAVDLAVTERVTLGPYRVGQTVTYTVVGSIGGTAAAGVGVNFPLPAGLTFVSANAGTGTYNSGTGVWTIGALAANGSTTLTVVARVAQTGDLTTTATISSSVNPDNNTDNNVATQTINAADNTFSEDVEGRIIDYCAAVTGLTISDVTTVNGREAFTGTIAANGTVSYTTPLLLLSGGTVTFNARASAVGTDNASRPKYTVNVLNEDGSVNGSYGPTNLTTNANTTVAVSVPYTQTGVRKVQIVLTRTGATTFLLDDIQVTNATGATRAKDASNCASNAAPVAADITAPAMSDQYGATDLPALSATDADGTIASYVITSLPDATQGVLTLNGTAVTSGQELTPAQAALLKFDPVSGYSGNVNFTYQAYDNSNSISNVGTVTIPVVITSAISGRIFDDVNYGGGAGRTYEDANNSAIASGFAAAAIGRTGVRVELYDETGAIQATATTTTGGAYTFANVFPGNYKVRVVNSTVTSVRATGSTPAGLVPVQTYAPGQTDRVGGERPLLVDAAANTGAQNLAALTSGSFAAQSIGTVQVQNRPPATTPSYDFGFNFDAVVNTNDNGQGSLRQFLLNSNGLTNAKLAQSSSLTGSSLTAGREYAVFMLSDGRTTGTPLPGLRLGTTAPAGYSSTTGVFTITPASTLPTITDANTVIDGKLQSLLTGETATSSATSTGAEIAIDFAGNTSVAGLFITGASTRIASVAFNGARGSSLVSPGGTVSDGAAITLSGAGVTGSVVTDITGTLNAIASVLLQNAATGVTISNNVFTTGIGFNGAGVMLTNASGNTISNNIISGNNGYGIELTGVGANTSNGNTISGNTISGNGVGTSSTQDAGISVTLGNNNLISANTILGNTGDGIVAMPGTSGNRFSQNTLFGNGQLGIDLSATAAQNGDEVSLNANGKTAASGANGLLNFPVITQVQQDGTTLRITGYSPQGALLEFFTADVNTNPNFGEGRTYLTSRTENQNGEDTDTRNQLSYSGVINGQNSGTETNVSRFAFAIPLSSLTTAQRTALTAANARITATATKLATVGSLTVGNTSEFSGNVAITTVSSGTPLPVELTVFAAKASGQNTQLNWSTASEKDNDHFTVERSLTGSEFVAIGTVKGSGSSTQSHTYSFTDAGIGAKHVGAVYYRLQQVDTNGTSSASPVRVVSFSSELAAATLEVYPNPTAGQTTLDLTALAAGTYQVTIVDATGRTVSSLSYAGGAAYQLDLQQAPQGTYVVLVRGQGVKLTKTLVKK